MPMSYVLHGLEGIEVVFNDENHPFRLVSDPDGVGGAPFKNNRLSSVAQAGGTYNGTSYEPLRLTLDVHMKGLNASGDVGLSYAKAWRKALGYGDREFLFDCVGPDYVDPVKTAKVRLENNLPNLNLDFIYNGGYFREKVVLVSDESWFHGVPLTQSWTYAELVGGSSVFSYGDIETPPRWEITGPITNPAISLGSETVTFTGTTIPAGETWVIETDSRFPSIKTAAGVNKARVVYNNANGPRSFHALIPPRESVLVGVTGTGTTGATHITITAPTLYIAGF